MLENRNYRLSLVLLGWLVTALLLQTTLAPQVEVMGVHPNLVLVVTILAGLLLGTQGGVWTGVLGGLLQDLMVGRYLGLFSLTGGIAGYLAGLTQGKLSRGNLVIPETTVLFISIIHGLLVLVLLRLTGVRFPPGVSLTSIILPEAVYNLVIVPFVYVPVYRTLVSSRARPSLGEGD